MARGKTVRTDKNADALRAALEAGWSLSGAAEQIGVSRNAIYEWFKADPALKEQCEEIYRGAGRDYLVDVARGRAVAGSDALLMFLVKQRDPSFRESYKVEHSGQIDIRKEAEEVAKELGVPVEMALAAADRIASGEIS